MTRWAGVGMLVSVACGQTAECERLETIARQRAEILDTVQRRAALAGPLQKKAEAAEARAERRLNDLGLGGLPTELHRTLEDRASAVERATLDASLDTGGSGARTDGDSSGWGVDFPAWSWLRARTVLEDLERSPPLFRFERMRPTLRGRFEVVLGRVRVPRVPLEGIQPQPLPARSPVAEVASEFGFCGAKDFRARIAEMDAKIDRLAEDAGRTTRFLPLSASWDGIARRAELVARAEHEARRVRDVLLGAAAEARLRIREVGVRENAVVMELGRANRDRGRLERRLAPELLKRVRFERDQTRKVLRVVVLARADSLAPAPPK